MRESAEDASGFSPEEGQCLVTANATGSVHVLRGGKRASPPEVGSTQLPAISERARGKIGHRERRVFLGSEKTLPGTRSATYLLVAARKSSK